MTEKDFDRWNAIKKSVEKEQLEPSKYPKEGEVWMSILGKNIGFEQNGGGENFSRPLLVIKKFYNHMFWIVPLSTKQKTLNFYYNFTDPETNNVSAIVAQIKLVSVKRLQRKMYALSSLHQQNIKELLKSFL